MKTWEEVRKRYPGHYDSRVKNAINILEELYNLNIIESIGYYTEQFRIEDQDVVNWEIHYIWD